MHYKNFQNNGLNNDCIISSNYAVTWEFHQPISHAFIHNTDEISANWGHTLPWNEKCPSKLNTILLQEEFLTVMEHEV